MIVRNGWCKVCRVTSVTGLVPIVLASLTFTWLTAGLFGCSNPKDDFVDAKAKNTIDGYQVFLDHHPESILADSASMLLRLVRFEQAVEAREPGLCQKFLSVYPEGRDADRIHRAVQDISMWDTINGTVDSSALKVYLESFEEPLFQLEAITTLEDTRLFRKAVVGDTLYAWETYVESYPEGFFVDSARARIAILRPISEAWEALGRTPNRQVLEAFAEEHNGSGYAKQAKCLIVLGEQRQIARRILGRRYSRKLWMR